MNLSITAVGEWLLRASWQAGVLALVIVAVQWFVGSRLSARWRYNMWMLVVLRLLLPVVPATQWSVHNWISLPNKSPQELPQASQLPVDAHLSVVVLEADPLPVQSPPRITPPLKPQKTWREYAIPAAWIIWLAGFCFFLVRTLFATAKLKRQSRQFTPITDTQILQILDSARQRMRICCRTDLFAAANLTTPALMGLLHPRILLPAKVVSEFHPSELRLIFLHELAHLRRRDVAINWLITLLNMLHWFNPFLWLAFAHIRAERELACDELVLKITQPDERREYGNTMIKLLQTLSGGSALPGAVGILEGQAPLRRRITMIAQFEPTRSRTWIALLTTLILAMVALTDSAAGQQKNRPARGAVPGKGPIYNPGATAQPGPEGTAPQPSVGGSGNPRFANVEHDKNTDAANEKTKEALRRMMPEVNFQNVTLKDAIDFIRDTSGLNIYVDWKAAEAAGVSQDVGINLRLRNVPAGEVLRLMLREASPEVRYQIESGIVVISTNPPKPSVIIKAYSIDDVTGDYPEARRSIQKLQEQLKAATDENQRVQYQQVIENMEAAREGRQRQRLQEIVELIQTAVAPYTSGMAVRAFDNKLIITADEAGHQEVAKILSIVRDRGEGGEAKPAEKPADTTRP